jgi:NAD-dependent deacetylase sirtuin 2
MSLTKLTRRRAGRKADSEDDSSGAVLAAEEDETKDANPGSMSALEKMMHQRVKVGEDDTSSSSPSDARRQADTGVPKIYNGLTLAEREAVFNGEPLTLETLGRRLKNNDFKKIMIMCGAGISVSAGIPDFRSRGGVFAMFKEKYKIDHPEKIMSIDFFRENPQLFTESAKEMMPGQFKPTLTHFFFKLLNEKGLLLRCFSQNIDALEKLAGIPDEKMVYAHGNFADCHCIDCGNQLRLTEWRTAIKKLTPPTCVKCDGLCKPDITFYGEGLPERYIECERKDPVEADLLIVLGTSLKAAPFNNLLKLQMNSKCPRVLINIEPAGTAAEGRAGGFDFGEARNYRDVFLQGKCDEVIMELCEQAGWTDELDAIVREGQRDYDGWALMCDTQPVDGRAAAADGGISGPMDDGLHRKQKITIDGDGSSEGAKAGAAALEKFEERRTEKVRQTEPEESFGVEETAGVAATDQSKKVSNQFT